MIEIYTFRRRKNMRKILIVVDMQNDFINGSLGTKEAEAIVPLVIDKIKHYKKENVFATRDTHDKDYLDTLEGKNLPVIHCLKNTNGWELQKDIAKLIDPRNIFDKPSFGSVELVNHLSQIEKKEKIEIELVGLCTDICVISNAVLLKSFLANTCVSIDSSCCAGSTKKAHEYALKSMESLQIKLK